MIKYFSLPGYWDHFYEIKGLLEYKKLHPSYFYMDKIIDSVYGFPPGLPWNGGRVNVHSNIHITPDQIYDFFNQYPEISLRHVCTNSLLDEKWIKDIQCNNYLQKYMRPQDAIIINSSLLYQHLRQFYSEKQFIWSTTLGIKDINKVNEISEKQMYVLNYIYNNNDNYLKQLKHPENIEVICMDECKFDCPNRLHHYEVYSRIHLGLPLRENDFLSCPYYTKEDHQLIPERILSRALTTEQAVTNQRLEELTQLGIQNFKISGRFTSTKVFFKLVLYYFIKPEYQDIAYKELCMTSEKMLLKQHIKFKNK